MEWKEVEKQDAANEMREKGGRRWNVFNGRQEDGVALGKDEMGCWCNVRLTGQCNAWK